MHALCHEYAGWLHESEKLGLGGTAGWLRALLLASRQADRRMDLSQAVGCIESRSGGLGFDGVEAGEGDGADALAAIVVVLAVEFHVLLDHVKPIPAEESDLLRRSVVLDCPDLIREDAPMIILGEADSPLGKVAGRIGNATDQQGSLLVKPLCVIWVKLVAKDVEKILDDASTGSRDGWTKL